MVLVLVYSSCAPFFVHIRILKCTVVEIYRGDCGQFKHTDVTSNIVTELLIEEVL